MTSGNNRGPRRLSGTQRRILSHLVHQGGDDAAGPAPVPSECRSLFGVDYEAIVPDLETLRQRGFLDRRDLPIEAGERQWFAYVATESGNAYIRAGVL